MEGSKHLDFATNQIEKVTSCTFAESLVLIIVIFLCVTGCRMMFYGHKCTPYHSEYYKPLLTIHFKVKIYNLLLWFLKIKTIYIKDRRTHMDKKDKSQPSVNVDQLGELSTATTLRIKTWGNVLWLLLVTAVGSFSLKTKTDTINMC